MCQLLALTTLTPLLCTPATTPFMPPPTTPPETVQELVEAPRTELLRVYHRVFDKFVSSPRAPPQWQCRCCATLCLTKSRYPGPALHPRSNRVGASHPFPSRFHTGLLHANEAFTYFHKAEKDVPNTANPFRGVSETGVKTVKTVCPARRSPWLIRSFHHCMPHGPRPRIFTSSLRWPPHVRALPVLFCRF